jgi:hypothetical protein
VVLHLKPEAKEFAEGFRLRSLVRRYSDHIAFPVRMQKEGQALLEYEDVNQAQALWTRARSDLKDEEYRDFYRHIAHDDADPLAWSHNRVEGKREYTSLLYVPAHARSTCGSARRRAGSSCTCGACSSWTTPSSSCRCTCASSRDHRFERPAAECLARAVAAGPRGRGDAQRADAPGPGDAGQAGQG